jgi:protein TonB
LPVPEGKRRKLIVLKAVIGEDGAVSDVQVYRGLVPEMDEAARVALSRWKFMPAIRDGKPVAVDILVGIQTEQSGTH